MFGLVKKESKSGLKRFIYEEYQNQQKLQKSYNNVIAINEDLNKQLEEQKTIKVIADERGHEIGRLFRGVI